MATTGEVLAEIGAGAVPQLFVCNKVDRLPGGHLGKELRAHYREAISLSARRPNDVASGRRSWLSSERDLVEQELLVPWERQQLRGNIYASSHVLSEEPGATGVVGQPAGAALSQREARPLPRTAPLVVSGHLRWPRAGPIVAPS